MPTACDVPNHQVASPVYLGVSDLAERQDFPLNVGRRGRKVYLLIR